MEECLSWEIKKFLVSQKIPHNLWNPKVQYRIHKRPPLVPILNQGITVHACSSHFQDIHFNNILPSTPRSSTRDIVKCFVTS